LLALHVQPGARHEGPAGAHGERLKFAVRAAPQEGRANEALLLALSAATGLARRAFALEAGDTSRRKSVRVSGSPEELREACARLEAGN
jgi:uncharacterized protein (TIGR00251 family)